jgi:hypothetical protein
MKDNTKPKSEPSEKSNQFNQYKKITQFQTKQFQNFKTKSVFRNRNMGGHR